jgi:pantoate kinase
VCYTCHITTSVHHILLRTCHCVKIFVRLLGESETAYAFERHFESQINIYGEQVLINLVNQSGREKIMSTAYENQLLILDCSELTYVAFDFHHHWYNLTALVMIVNDC